MRFEIPGVELDNIRLPGKSEPMRNQREPAGNADPGARFRRPVMGAIVERSPFRGEPVLSPLLLEMNQGALALAEKEMLQRGDREKVHVRAPELQSRTNGSGLGRETGCPPERKRKSACLSISS